MNVTIRGVEIEVEQLEDGRFVKPAMGQFTKSGRGCTWLDDCRVPTSKQDINEINAKASIRNSGVNFDVAQGKSKGTATQANESGRFPANLLVSDDVLNDGVIQKSGKAVRKNIGISTSKEVYGSYSAKASEYTTDLGYADSGSYSRYFDLDKWAAAHLPEQQMKTFPFAIFPKASKSEKNKGLEHLPKTHNPNTEDKPNPKRDIRPLNLTANSHPTVKPLKLMSYLITLTTREGDTVLDPFVGSGTTVVAANSLNRKGIGIEREEEYAEIARARVEANRPEPKLALEGE